MTNDNGKLKREPGFYWVQYRHEQEWIIAEYIEDDDWWCVTGNNWTWDDSDFSVIGERITHPGSTEGCA